MRTRLTVPSADSDRSANQGHAREPRDGAPVVIRVPLAPVGEQPTRERPDVCQQCGSMGFNVHQHTLRTVRDPHIKRVEIARYVCKRCGSTIRMYPSGIGPQRQSKAIKQICSMLYCMGLTYRNVQQVLSAIGCPLSMTTIREDVLRACAVDQAMRPFERLHLKPIEPGRFTGPDGSINIRLIGSAPGRRWLEIEVQERVGGAELEWRAQVCARHFTAWATSTGI